MKSIQVYDFHDYRAYLNEYILHCPLGKHGEKSRIASAIRCHNGYFSQILMGKADLSIEQAQDLAEYLSLTPEETDYLILIVSYGRAGTKKLREYYFAKIRSIEEKRMRLQNRIQSAKAISKEDQNIYFSAWYYSVIHLGITSLPGFDSVPGMQKLLNLPGDTIKEALQFLENAGLIQRDGGRFKAGSVDIYLGADSSMIRAHHTHWRLRAMHSLDRQNAEETHYSAVVTLNREDFVVIRKQILKFLEGKRKTVSESKNENTLAALTLDWFMI